VAAAERLALIATCASGLEEILDGELEALGAAARERQRGAVRFAGGWRECWRANWRLRTANRVLVELASWPAEDGAALAAGARAVAAGSTPGVESESEAPGVDLAALLHPDRSFAIQATATASRIRDTRWAALSAKDGLVDGQRDRYGRRSDVDRERPDLHLRLRVIRPEISSVAVASHRSAVAVVVIRLLMFEWPRRFPHGAAYWPAKLET